MKSPAPLSMGLPGWYGKLPSLGDFASRRLPDEFIHHWDEWLQLGLDQVRSSVHGHGRDVALHRFWVGPRVLSDASWAGVLVPSVDRVGRRFPLTIAAPLEAHPLSLATALAARSWYAAIEGVARRCVDEKLSLGQFERELADAAAVPLPAQDASRAAALAAELLSLPEDGADMSSAETDAGSVWWQGEAKERGQFLRVPALPLDEAFATLAAPPSATSAGAGR
jgi:type VI secretion system protein ImpM